MKLAAFVPSAPEIGREAIIVLAGALLAVVIVKQLPADWQAWFTLGSNKQ